MEALVIILLLVFVVLLILPFVALAKASGAQIRSEALAAQVTTLEIEMRRMRQAGTANGTRIEELTRKMAALEIEIQTFKRAGTPSGDVKQSVSAPVEEPSFQPTTPPSPAVADGQPKTAEAVVPEPKPAEILCFEPSPTAPPPVVPPQLPKIETAPQEWESSPRFRPRPEAAKQKLAPTVPAISLEQFMGAKLFAWIGGLALFFGIAFFIKYSFEQNLIPPQVRAATGFLAGIGLLVGGVIMKRKETAVTAQTLCSTGVLVLYGVTFACKALYHFQYFGTGPTFLLMTLITAAAFLLSVRLNAMVVAVLGIAGGFLTPVLLSSGQDAPLGLFGYIALLDIGLLAVALRQRWATLPALGAIGTVLMQVGWIAKFFVAEHYFADNKVLIPMAVFLGFQALFLAAAAWGKRTERLDKTLSLGAILLGSAALLVAFFFLQFETLGHRPVLFLGYVLLADLGLLALVFLKDEILAMAEVATQWATFLLVALWTHQYFDPGFLYPALAAYLVFALLHLALPMVMRRRAVTTQPWWLYAVPIIALPFYFLSFDAFAGSPVLFFGAVFLVNLGMLCAALLDEKSAPTHAAAGVAAFLLLALWTGNNLTPTHLHAALAFYFVFALFHSAAPLVMRRLRGTPIPWWCSSVPALALVLVMMPLFKLTELSLLIWPLVLMIDLLAVVLAVVTAALMPIVIVLGFTLLAMGAWIFRIPSELTGLPTSLFLLGGFAIFFIAAATWACRKLMSRSSSTMEKDEPSLFGDFNKTANLAVQIPALSATMPFLLLIMLTLRLPVANPSPVFGLALLLVVLLLGLTKIMALWALPAIGLACVVALEQTWQLGHFNPAQATVPLAWHLLFYAVFTAFPFVFHRQFAKSALPWAAAALAGPAHFYLLHHLVNAACPNLRGVMGLLPAAFSVPALLGVVALLKRTPAESPARDTQLAWFGGVALFFITLIFPIQFDRQWITIGWALEGAALCWLFQRVPHPGLRITGVALLAVAFARLALNPAVLSYHARSATPILNWYLYAYGITLLCLFAGARLLARPRNEVAGINVPPLLYALGTVLAFLLVNIEIADFFSQPGVSVLTFQFCGNFARDMSYSIAWALFALLLLVVGIAKRLAPVRYASIALLAVTLLKLFLHDLSQLEQLYRIAAFIVVAVIAMLASFLYQRFLGTPEKPNETDPAL